MGSQETAQPASQHPDDNIESTFNYVPAQKTWLYRHEGAENLVKLDKEFPLANFVLSAFDAREIGPTSNNKQSSRSHVAVKLLLEECKKLGGKNVQTAVFDLAGVENVFDCNQGSSDIIRMKAKIITNKNYSNNLGSEIEPWENLQKKESW